MSLRDRQEPTLTTDGELLVGRETLQVPIAVRTNVRDGSASIEFEAQQSASPNQSVRLGELSGTELRQLREAIDEILQLVE